MMLTALNALLFVLVIDALFFLDPGHCLSSWQDEKYLYVQPDSRIPGEETR